MDIKTIFKDFLEADDIQHFINNRFQSKDHTVIQNAFLRQVSEITMSDGIKIRPVDYPDLLDLNVFASVRNEYDFTDLWPTDRVLDIGANIGAWSVMVAKRGCSVIAIEPLYYRELLNIVRRNNLDVKIIRCAIGDGAPQILSYGRRKELVNFRKFSDIILEHGPFDFVKIDCEGGEWSIHPEDLAGVRRIEGELHNLPGLPKPNWALFDYIKKNYRVKIEAVRHGKLWLFHAFKK